MEGKQTKRGHQHVEAFCLMAYQCAGSFAGIKLVDGAAKSVRIAGCGHREVFWNSRDGVTPFMMVCPSCGGDLHHIDWSKDVYAPDHKPYYGQGIWRDGTPDEAERIIRKRIAQHPPQDAEGAECLEAVIASARTGEEQGEFRKGWPMFYRHGMEQEQSRFDTEQQFRAFLDSLHEMREDGAVTQFKYEPAQRALSAMDVVQDLKSALEGREGWHSMAATVKVQGDKLLLSRLAVLTPEDDDEAQA